MSEPYYITHTCHSIYRISLSGVAYMSMSLEWHISCHSSGGPIINWNSFFYKKCSKWSKTCRNVMKTFCVSGVLHLCHCGSLPYFTTRVNVCRSSPILSTARWTIWYVTVFHNIFTICMYNAYDVHNQYIYDAIRHITELERWLKDNKVMECYCCEEINPPLIMIKKRAN